MGIVEEAKLAKETFDKFDDTETEMPKKCLYYTGSAKQGEKSVDIKNKEDQEDQEENEKHNKKDEEEEGWILVESKKKGFRHPNQDDDEVDCTTFEDCQQLQIPIKHTKEHKHTHDGHNLYKHGMRLHLMGGMDQVWGADDMTTGWDVTNLDDGNTNDRLNTGIYRGLGVWAYQVSERAPKSNCAKCWDAKTGCDDGAKKACQECI